MKWLGLPVENVTWDGSAYRQVKEPEVTNTKGVDALRQPKNLSAFLLLAFSVGCSTTGQVSHQFATVEKSGFLGDYSILREGERGEALFIYANPAYEERYDKILLEPITVWCSEETGLGDLSREDAQHLAHYLHNALVRELSDDFKFVDAPGPGVLRIRSAITEAEESRVVLDTATTVVPLLRPVSLVKKLATGTHAFVGKASIEIELTDSVTGELLGAAVDRRAGRKVPRGSLSTWADVKDAFDYWAKHIRERFREERTRNRARI